MRQVLCPIVAGLDEELGLLAEAVEAVSSARGGAVFVLGEAGIGMSRLAREVVQSTVEKHVASLIAKTGVSDRRALIRLGAQLTPGGGEIVADSGAATGRP